MRNGDSQRHMATAGMATASAMYPGHGAGGVDEVDMEALRAKYARPREVLEAEAAQKQTTALGGSASDAKAMADAYDKLSDIVMCQGCQALGTVKRQYDYRVIDEECNLCDGEGVLRKGQAKYATAELKQKVREVEAMVAASEDLDELERLEAALKKRTIAALDAVLKTAPPDMTPAAAAPEVEV